MAFECPHCNYTSREVQPGQSLADSAIIYEVTVNSSRDMNRRVIKSENAVIIVPELDIEIPRKTQKGKLSTIEGFLSETKESLNRAYNEGVYDEMGDDIKAKIKQTIEKVENALNLKNLPFKFIIDDLGGNSFIENPYAPSTDPYCKISHYQRTREQMIEIGYIAESADKEQEKIKNEIKESDEVKKEVKFSAQNPGIKFDVYKSTSKISAHLLDLTKSIQNNEDINKEAMIFQTDCYVCFRPGDSKSCIITIPYFKELIVSCFKCEYCGYKNVEVKGGGGFSDKARRITLNVKNESDLSRDCFKSETCKITIPEIDFSTDTGSLGGIFTTIEGLIDKLVKNIEDIPFSKGDSDEKEDTIFEKMINSLKSLLTVNKEYTIILDDTLANSFVAGLTEEKNPETDPQIKIEDYERTYEQNEELGLNQMNVDNYLVDEEDKSKEVKIDH